MKAMYGPHGPFGPAQLRECSSSPNGHHCFHLNVEGRGTTGEHAKNTCCWCGHVEFPSSW